MKSPRIIGVVLSKNSWGILAASITHALLNHVDKIYVLDHNSADETHNGLKYLKDIWRERLFVLNYGAYSFDQEEITNTIIHIANESSPEWIYVFDSDEFLVIDEKRSLRDVLREYGDEQISVIRYRLENYISLSDFDVNNLAHYEKLCYKSMPTRKYDFRLAYSDIYNGKATFFDYPFPSKIIFRAGCYRWIKTGAHRLIDVGGDAKEVNDSRIRCAHLAYPSKNMLINKAIHGENLVASGLPKSKGWQSQLLYQINREGRLDWFWQRHSISDLLKPVQEIPRHQIEDTVCVCTPANVKAFRRKI